MFVHVNIHLNSQHLYSQLFVKSNTKANANVHNSHILLRTSMHFC